MAHEPLHTMGQQHGRRSWAEPWKIKMVEPLTVTTREQRERRARRGRLQHVPAPLATTSTSTSSPTPARPP